MTLASKTDWFIHIKEMKKKSFICGDGDQRMNLVKEYFVRCQERI